MSRTLQSHRDDLIERIEQRTRLAGHNRLGLLLFRAGRGALFAVNVFKVQEVMLKQPLFPLPGLPKGFEGAVDFRGRTIAVMDLCKHLPLPEDHRESSGFMIVTEFNQSVQGFLVQSVERIINVAVEDLQPPPDMGQKGTGLLTAVTRYQGELVQVLDLESILAETLGSMTLAKEWVVDEDMPISGYPKRVLVVDDSRVARQQIKNVLDALNLESVQLSDGAQALEHLKTMVQQGQSPEETYLMVISDIEMPAMDGYTLTSEIRNQLKLSHLFVLLHTSLSGVFNKAMIEKVGANAFVPKYSAQVLAKKVVEQIKIRAVG